MDSFGPKTRKGALDSRIANTRPMHAEFFLTGTIFNSELFVFVDFKNRNRC